MEKNDKNTGTNGMSDDGSVEIKDLVKTYVDDRGRPKRDEFSRFRFSFPKVS